MTENQDYYLSQEFYNKIMAEADAEEEKRNMELIRTSNRILKAVSNVMGKRFYKSVLEIIKALELSNDIAITRKPYGQLNKEKYGVIESYYVSQSTAYPCEDCWYGDVYIKLNKGRFLKIHFAD